VSVAEASPSRTESSNVSVVLAMTAGAVNVGGAAVAAASATVGPAVCGPCEREAAVARLRRRRIRPSSAATIRA